MAGKAVNTTFGAIVKWSDTTSDPTENYIGTPICPVAPSGCILSSGFTATPLPAKIVSYL